MLTNYINKVKHSKLYLESKFFINFLHYINLRIKTY